MTQLTKAFAVNPDNLSSIPRAHIKWEERTDFMRLTSDLHIHAIACTCLPIANTGMIIISKMNLSILKESTL